MVTILGFESHSQARLAARVRDDPKQVLSEWTELRATNKSTLVLTRLMSIRH